MCSELCATLDIYSGKTYIVISLEGKIRIWADR